MRDGAVQDIKCLSTYPNWMYDQRNVIKFRSLSSLIIPGTHHSGSYSKLQPQSTIAKFAATQDKDVFEQLILGARYFDLRPCKDKNYWICHGSFLMNPLKQIIDDVKKFMNNTHEIVILAFKEFSVDFKEASDHLSFIDYLEKQFSEFLMPRSSKLWKITCREIWVRNKRLIISYNHHIYNETKTMWPAIPQKWGDVSSLENLKNHLTLVEADQQVPRVAMAEFTLDTWMVVSHTFADVIGLDHTSLRELGAYVGPYITQWYNEIFYSNMSIVAVDYLDSTGIIEVAIEWNRRRYSSCYYNYTDIV